jgi:peroxiredoxin Q/BCP
MIRFKSSLQLGQMAPDFAAEDASGKLWRLADFKGHRVLLYFYPSDFTPGCTAQACAFRDAETQFRDLDVQIFGVSGDSKERHAAFAQKFALPFRLLSDSKAKLREAYGIPHVFGRLWGRTSFLIGPGGTIEFIFNSRQKAVEHVSRSLEFLSSKGQPSSEGS